MEGVDNILIYRKQKIENRKQKIENRKSLEKDKQRKAKLKVTVDQTGISEVVKPKSNKSP